MKFSSEIMNSHNHHSSNQNPAAASALQQVNSISNQQMCNGNGGGLYPNSGPIVAPSCFMNIANHPFPLQSTVGQFPNNNIGGFNPQQNFNSFPVNQFYPSQQQGQFFANNSMIPTLYNQNVGLANQQQVLLQSTIQNIQQLLQLQNPNHTQFSSGNSPMFQNQISNVTNHQNSGFPLNQQFGMSNANGSVQHANQGQQRLVSPMMDTNVSKQLPNMGQQLPRNTVLPHMSGPVQPQQAQNLLAAVTNYQNQIVQGVGPQNHIFPTNQLFAMANPNGPVQHVTQGQQRFVSPMMDFNASRPMANMVDQGSSILPLASASVQTQNSTSTLTNPEESHGNMSANVNGGRAESQSTNFTGHKRSDASHTGFKSPHHHAKHVKKKFGSYNRNTNEAKGNRNAATNSSSRNLTKFEKKVPSQKYTEQEINQWREARKKHFPTSANMDKKHRNEEILSDVTNQEAVLRRQQLKEILAKQAELGCEVAEIPSSYLAGDEKHIDTSKKHERGRDKRGRFRNKRGTQWLQDDRFAKKSRPGDQKSFKNNHRTYEPKPKVQEPSLLQKLLARDIKRDKSHLLQVFRFIAVNSFLSGEPAEPLRFPSVIVRETDSDGIKKTDCIHEGSSDKAVEMLKGQLEGEELVEEEEGEIID